VEGFRVNCSSGGNLNDIVAALKDDSIDRLDIHNCSLGIKKLVSFPPMKVRVLTISGCGIEKISPNAFNNIANGLEELRLMNNLLTSIPILSNLTDLESLNLNNNKLTDIPEKCFEGNPKLRQLRFENNRICSLSHNTLNEVKSNLELLDLSGNCLSTVPAANLRNSSLMYLDLSANRISDLSPMSFVNLPNLKELRLSSNRLSVFSPMAFMGVPALSHLLLSDNLINNINGLQMFKELEVIDLNKNAMTTVPSFKDLIKLKRVHLDYNKIRSISTMTFSSNPNLQMISMQDNQISLIAKNSFEGLDQLVILYLGNNSLESIEERTFYGMKNLQQLSLRNNSLVKIENGSFSSLPMLNVLDLSYNKIRTIQPGSFSPLKNLFWLDLSNNNFTTFEKGAFDRRIPNIILDGNSFYCDEKFEWFVTYLVKNQVRTFIPSQPEITCSGPEKYVGVRLKDLMIKKANETVSQGLSTLGWNSAAGSNTQPNVLANLIPLLSQGANNPSGAGFLNYITQAIPSLRNIPGMNPASRNANQGSGGSTNLNSALEEFSEPLVRFATGGQPAPSDVRQLIQSIPNLVVNIPGIGNVDISKVPPPILEHVLNGGQIPGIPKETLDTVVKYYTSRMYEAAKRARDGQLQQGDEKYLPNITTLPQGVIDSVASGSPLPYLTNDQTNVIRAYYTQQIPVQMTESSKDSSGIKMNPQMFSMMSLLPPNFNFSLIPPEVMKQVMRGEMPDLSQLPHEVLDYIRENSEKMFKSFKVSPNASLEEILSKLPSFEPPTFNTTLAPYDINHVEDDLVVEEDAPLFSKSNVRVYTAIILGLFATISLAILSVYCFYLRRAKTASDRMNLQNREIDDGGEFFGDNDKEHLSQFTPTASSTMKDLNVTDPRRNRPHAPPRTPTSIKSNISDQKSTSALNMSGRSRAHNFHV